MFDVGFWELFLIGLIALIVFGPERLPGLARTVGLWIGRARAAFYSVREEMEREINADGLRETQRALRRELEKNTQPLAKTAPITDAATERQTPPSAETPATTAERALEGAQKAPSRHIDEPAPPANPKDNEPDAGHIGRNTR